MLNDVDTYTDPVFGLHVPRHIEGIPDELLHPRSTWSDPAAYDARAHDLARRFAQNFQQFTHAATEVAQAGPHA
jgi:phosphoenolpyruvate carboxykinase (ATP)